MENAAADRVAVRLDEGSDPTGLIVTDLVALIGHVQASLRLIEAAIAREAVLAERQADTDIVVRDDVSPHCLTASTALKACDAGLGAALDRLRDSGTPARLLN
ncbi:MULTISPECIES: hypothetical protein [Bradyrhizobium]|jgi:hypothetical protein|uniref:hypothetical protein n=1 Tax=Bradyrhizobium elkanii TaxID=29448 RepID=UPI002715067F|nr:hypothetical protein [Bradyrhizobium elkanii]WLA48256.1 hypothetical protein QIH80_42985 [Bradyrhizobium elkanii]WLB81541.1 hypothetical protein QIH83_02475 [Bradyrhizobium elkanii]